MTSHNIRPASQEYRESLLALVFEHLLPHLNLEKPE